MINRYPLWKNLLIVAVVLVTALYALPNLFPEDPAVQVSHASGELPGDTQERIARLLTEHQVPFKDIETREGTLLIRLPSLDLQLRAQDMLRETLESRYIVALNLAPATPGWLQAIHAAPVSLGLDLRGGVYFLLEVDTQAALTQTYEGYVNDFRTLLRDADLRYQAVQRVADGMSVEFREPAALSRAQDMLEDEFPNLTFTPAEDNPRVLQAHLTPQAIQEIKRFAVQQNITTLRKRVDELGVAEPLIQQQGEGRIVVQLPGVQDTAQAKEILGATATLEFHLVDEEADPEAAQRTGRAPAGSALYLERGGQPIVLKKRVLLTGEHIIDAASGIDQQSGGAAVFISLDGTGARQFSRTTGENVGHLMAVVFIEDRPETVVRDGEKVRVTHRVEEVINVARILEQLGRRFQITGLDSTREARKLALLLRAGALAAPMQIVEERTIGPSLGQQNIEQGFKSVAIALVLVMAFMALYYRVFGLVANLALALNVVLIMGILSMIPGATLTLPGIAGIVLTVGMAVDANVLIYERIREELRAGNSPQASIYAGYDKAFGTIADSNITTLIAGLVLFAFGTGPIKGFAITLSIGLASSMFTAIMVTRAVINLLYGGKRAAVLAI